MRPLSFRTYRTYPIHDNRSHSYSEAVVYSFHDLIDFLLQFSRERSVGKDKDLVFRDMRGTRRFAESPHGDRFDPGQLKQPVLDAIKRPGPHPALVDQSHRDEDTERNCIPDTGERLQLGDLSLQ